MIFVTLGTQDKKFLRLLKAVEKLNIKEKIVIQAGSTKFKSEKKNIEVYKFLTSEELEDYMKKARVIISHAGVGSILLGLKYNKKMIVASRLQKYKEHVNDHQLQILEIFSNAGYILAMSDFNDLQNLLDKEFIPKKFTSNNERFNKKLFNEIVKD